MPSLLNYIGNLFQLVLLSDIDLILRIFLVFGLKILMDEFEVDILELIFASVAIEVGLIVLGNAKTHRRWGYTISVEPWNDILDIYLFALHIIRYKVAWLL